MHLFFYFSAGEWSLRTFKYWQMRFPTSSLTWSGPGRCTFIAMFRVISWHNIILLLYMYWLIERNTSCVLLNCHISYFDVIFVLCVRVDQAGVICQQEGIFRVNCMDCLDRTNVVQAAIARVVMEQQVHSCVTTKLFLIILLKLLINQ